MNKVNQSIGCEVSECMFNCEGKNCTLDKIVVGNTCDCEHLLRKLPQALSASASQRKAARGERLARLSFLRVSRAGSCPPAVRSSRV